MHQHILLLGYWGFTQWLSNNLITCPFKKLTGIDCPGCGFQRSVIALLQGNVIQSLHYYPATFFIIIVLLYSLLQKYLPFTTTYKIKRNLYIISALVIGCSYAVKISYLYLLH